MTKVLIAYVIAGAGLFGALFAAFALSGIAVPADLPAAQSETAESLAEPAKPAEPPPGTFVPPTLEPGRLYRISHATPVYSEPSTTATDSVKIPDGGSFVPVRTLDSTPDTWFEVTINDGKRDRTMYLQGIDLRWKIVTPVYSHDEVVSLQKEATIRAFRSVNLLRRKPPPPPPAPPPPGPSDFSEWWAQTAQQLGGPVQANLVASGSVAALTTILTIGAIALLATFRRQSSWTKSDIYIPETEDIAYNPYASDTTGEDADGDNNGAGRPYA